MPMDSIKCHCAGGRAYSWLRKANIDGEDQTQKDRTKDRTAELGERFRYFRPPASNTGEMCRLRSLEGMQPVADQES